MKKLLLFGLVVAGFGAVKAQSITAEDLRWEIGNQWNAKVNIVDMSSIDFTAGTGKTWDFSSYTAGSDDTIKVVASTAVDVKISSNLTGDNDYKKLTDNFSLGVISGVKADDVTVSQIGLPHSVGGTWNTTATALFGAVTVNTTGSVLSSGTITIPYGTFNAILVQETFTGSVNQTNYYWETAEHGRVAVYSKGKLLVVQSTNHTVSTRNIEGSNGLSVFPNPATTIITVQSDATNAVVKVIDAVGSVAKEVAFTGGSQQINVTDLSAGTYVVQVISATGIETSTVVVK